MHNSEKSVEGCWVSIVLRIAVASLFGAAAIPKFLGGLDGIVTYFQSVFKDTWLPLWLVTAHARVVPFAEALIAVWLLAGFRLRSAWIFTALFMTSLAFGQMVAGQYGNAANNYNYVLITCAGLYFSRYDCWNLDRLFRK